MSTNGISGANSNSWDKKGTDTNSSIQQDAKTQVTQEIRKYYKEALKNAKAVELNDLKQTKMDTEVAREMAKKAALASKNIPNYATQELKKLEQMEKELAKEKENLEKSLFVKEHPELKVLGEERISKMSLEDLKGVDCEKLRSSDFEEVQMYLNLIDRDIAYKEALAKNQDASKQLSPKEQAKAELRKLESEYNKNYEKMTSEEIIELEFKMDTIKKNLVLGKYDDANIEEDVGESVGNNVGEPDTDNDKSHLIVRPQMLQNYKTQKEEIENQLKDPSLSDEERTRLETLRETIVFEIYRLKNEIKEDVKKPLGE